MNKECECNMKCTVSFSSVKTTEADLRYVARGFVFAVFVSSVAIVLSECVSVCVRV